MKEKEEKKEEKKEGELVLCTVEKILGTTVFARLEDGSEGTIIFSEIAPGRIRNIRDYVVPGKKIVCKILKSEKGRIELSLRRVTSKEKATILKAYEKEKKNLALIKSICKNDAILEKIKELGLTATQFLQKPDEELKKYFSDEEISRLKAKKEEIVEIKKKIYLRSFAENGVLLIRKVFSSVSSVNTSITYIGAPFYSVSVKARDYKEANKKMDEVLKKILETAKQLGCEAEIK